MKPILPLAVLVSLTLAACGGRECCGTCHGEKRDANQNAANQAEKSFDKENPADPAALQAAPK
jgi:hypothetical protein